MYCEEDKNKIKLIISDFDGIFTDGTGIIDINGQVSKKIHFHDVMAIAIAFKMGYKVVIITGEHSGAVDYLDNKFPMLEVHQGIKHKLELVKEILNKNNIKKEELLYIGDDVNDAESLLYAGYRVTVPNAHPVIKKIENIKITERFGGQGVFREVIDSLTIQEVEKAIVAGELCK